MPLHWFVQMVIIWFSVERIERFDADAAILSNSLLMPAVHPNKENFHSDETSPFYMLLVTVQ